VSALSQAYRRHRFAILFFSLLATLAGEPLLRAAGLEADLLQVFLAFNALAAVLGSLTGTARRILLGLLALFAVFRVAGLALATTSLMAASEVVWAFVALFTLAGTLRTALRRGPVDTERIYAALSVYIVAGLIFGVIYWVYEQTWPGSFATAANEELTEWRMIYFSFVTLGSLGYGDILPLNDAARGTAILEVVSGQIYLAVLLARLVSLYATNERVRPDTD
jgi:hypothetical protein